jgi:HEAT repeat protein
VSALLVLALLAHDMSKDPLADLKALGKSKDVVGAVDKLGASLDSMDEKVREATLSALRELLATRDFPKLLDDDFTPIKTRRNVLKALRYLKDARYTPRVVKALADSEVSIRSEAALTLSVFGAEAAERELITALSDREKDVRYYAADALGGLRSEPAKKAVADRLAVETDKTVLFSLQQAQRKQRR